MSFVFSSSSFGLCLAFCWWRAVVQSPAQQCIWHVKVRPWAKHKGCHCQRETQAVVIIYVVDFTHGTLPALWHMCLSYCYGCIWVSGQNRKKYKAICLLFKLPLYPLSWPSFFYIPLLPLSLSVLSPSFPYFLLSFLTHLTHSHFSLSSFLFFSFVLLSFYFYFLLPHLLLIPRLPPFLLSLSVLHL